MAENKFFDKINLEHYHRYVSGMIKRLSDNIDERIDEKFKNFIEDNVSDGEILDARGGERTLGDRLDKFDEKYSEVSSQLEHIEKLYDNGFIFIDNIEGVIKFDTEEEALTNLHLSNNSEIIQKVLNENKKIFFGQGYYPFKKYLGIHSGCNIKSKGATLLFPQSKGLVTDKIEFCSEISVTDINIYSLDNCIDFTNDKITYPYNVYMSEFSNLRLRSDRGHCVYGGDIRGYGGDQLCFDLKFYNIKVNAPNGSGFYGFGGLMTFYERITDWGKIKNVFQNCTGIWRDCNTSFAGAEYFLLYDKNGRADYGSSIELYNVNMETVSKGGIYIDNSTVSHNNIILENSSVAIKPTGVKINTHPFYFGLETKYLKVLNSRINIEDGKTWTDVFGSMPQTILSIAGTSNMQVDGENVKVYDRNVQIVRTFNGSTKINNPTIMDFYSEAYNKTNETHSFNFVGGRVQNFLKTQIDSGLILLNNSKETYDGIIIDDVQNNATNIESIYVKNLPTGKLFTIVNNSGQELQIISTDGYDSKFILKNSNVKTLSNKGAITFLLQCTGIDREVIKFIEL